MIASAPQMIANLQSVSGPIVMPGEKSSETFSSLMAQAIQDNQLPGASSVSLTEILKPVSGSASKVKSDSRPLQSTSEGTATPQLSGTDLQGSGLAALASQQSLLVPPTIQPQRADQDGSAPAENVDKTEPASLVTRMYSGAEPSSIVDSPVRPVATNLQGSSLTALTNQGPATTPTLPQAVSPDGPAAGAVISKAMPAKGEPQTDVRSQNALRRWSCPGEFPISARGVGAKCSCGDKFCCGFHSCLGRQFDNLRCRQHRPEQFDRIHCYTSSLLFARNHRHGSSSCTLDRSPSCSGCAGPNGGAIRTATFDKNAANASQSGELEPARFTPENLDNGYSLKSIPDPSTNKVQATPQLAVAPLRVASPALDRKSTLASVKTASDHCSKLGDNNKPSNAPRADGFPIIRGGSARINILGSGSAGPQAIWHKFSERR